jgi:hypothetical protein
MARGYPDGERTAALLHRAGWCLGPLNMTEAQAAAACHAWNQHNIPPLPDEKVRTTVASIAHSEAKKRESNARPIVAASEVPRVAELEPQATFKRLAALPPFEYDRVRLKEAERLGVRVGTLDDEVAKLRADDEPPASAGRSLTLKL